MNIKTKLLLFLLITLMLYLYPQSAFAHRMIVESLEDGLLFVRYDDGTPASLAIVTLYDVNGKVLLEKEVDENGQLAFDTDIQTHRIIADDGLGHRAALIPDQPSNSESIPLIIRALLGVSIMIFIACVFYFRNKNKRGA